MVHGPGAGHAPRGPGFAAAFTPVSTFMSELHSAAVTLTLVLSVCVQSTWAASIRVVTNSTSHCLTPPTPHPLILRHPPIITLLCSVLRSSSTTSLRSTLYSVMQYSTVVDSQTKYF